jgi:hypothetical protein
MLSMMQEQGARPDILTVGKDYQIISVPQLLRSGLGAPFISLRSERWDQSLASQDFYSAELFEHCNYRIEIA